MANIHGQDQILGVNSVVGGSNHELLCRDKAKQSLAFGHIPWNKSELAKFGISFNY